MTLLEIRKSLKLSQAEVCKEASVSVYALRKLEHGKLNVKLHVVALLMKTYKAYGIDISSLII